VAAKWCDLPSDKQRLIVADARRRRVRPVRIDGNPQLFGGNAANPTFGSSRCARLRAVKLCDLQFTRYAGTIIFPKRFLPKEKWNNIAIAEANAEIEKHLAILAQHLAAKSYLVAEQFSLADVCYVPFLEFFPLMEITPPTAVAAWSERLLSRPSAVTTRPEK
jgi:glutathione S-transferase